jgi:hypothetical protein
MYGENPRKRVARKRSKNTFEEIMDNVLHIR